MTNKTRHYTIIYEDGTYSETVWGGDASSLRKYLEKTGNHPTIIFNLVKPVWVRKGDRIYDQER
jgi:hypothetical protein